MGRRSRKRASERPRPTPPPRARRRPRDEGRPPAPWGRFPLVELCVLIALAIGIGGFVLGSGVMLAAAAGLGSLAGLEVAIREHFAGFRSHSTVLAGMPAIVAMAVLFFGGAPQGVVLAAGAVLFGAAFWGMRELFKRRSGGWGFK